MLTIKLRTLHVNLTGGNGAMSCDKPLDFGYRPAIDTRKTDAAEHDTSIRINGMATAPLRPAVNGDVEYVGRMNDIVVGGINVMNAGIEVGEQGAIQVRWVDGTAHQ